MCKQIQYSLLLLSIFLTLSTSVFSQFGSRGEELNYVDAENFYKGKNYYDALPLYQILFDKHPRIIEYRLKIGICHLYLADSTEKAIEYLNEVYTRKPKEQDVLYYLGKAYAINYKFDLAIETFNSALSSKYVSANNKEEIPHLIEQANNAIVLMKDSLPVEIINIGQPINSANNEHSPTVSADETTLIFTYKGIKSTGQRQDDMNRAEVSGNFYEDIFVSQYISNEWTDPKPIGDSINTHFHEASISLSPDGQTLFLYKGDPKFSGEILEVRKQDGKWGTPKSLAINTKDWEGHAAVSPNGKFMIFSSERDGGEGLRDLYSAVLQEDSTWGEVENLGPTINTKYNDDAPFIHSDGVTFNFSSEGHNSMGGYDIFESMIRTDSSYLEPRNIGYPINTPANDIFFYVSGRGRAYYSSAKKGGFGQQDIYVINVNDITTSKPVLLVKGIVRTNNDFDVANITVRTESGKDLGVYHSDLSDGKYQFYVDLNDYYVISYEVDGFPAQVESIDATKYTEYTEIEKDINFLSRDVSINGVALINENPLSPIMNMQIRITNKDNTFSAVETTDENGKYNFENLPNGDDYYIMLLDEEDEKRIQDSTYLFKGRITMEGLPHAEATINELPVKDDGAYRIEVRNYRYFDMLLGSKDGLDDLSLEDLMNRYGDQKDSNLVFKIQVAAYTNAANYNANHLRELGSISKIVLSDGITRFMIGEFETLRLAEEFQRKVISKGQDDAFILMFLNGERTYLEELIDTKVFK